MADYYIHIIPSIIAFFSVFFIINITYKISFKIGLVDKPNHRKTHKEVTPLTGGVAIFVAFTLSCLATQRVLLDEKDLFSCMLIIFILGVLDDLGDLSVKKRVLVQISVILYMCYFADVRVNNLGDILGFGNISLGYLAVPFTVFFAIGVINSLNLIDGIDGLCAGVILIALINILILGTFDSGDKTLSIVLYIFAAVLCFLIINLNLTKFIVGKVFLGDSGSTLLGLFIVWNLIKLTQSPNQVIRPVAALFFIALPIFDTLSVFAARLLNGQSPFAHDRKHIHYLLIALGLKERSVLLLLMLFSLLLSSIGTILELLRVSELSMSLLLIIMLVSYQIIFFQLLKKSN